MTKLRFLALIALSTGFALTALQACSSDDAGDGDGDASVGSSSSGKTGSSSSGGRSSSSGSSSSSGGSSTSSGGASSSGGSSSSSSGSSSGDLDASVEEPDACAVGGESTLDAGSFCGSYEFRRPPAVFGPVDADAGEGWGGGDLAAGTYDAVKVEFGVDNGGSIRETLVLDGAGHFTRIRQIKSAANATPGPVTQRSGTYSTAGSTLTLAATCTVQDGASAENKTESVQYEVTTDACGLAQVRYGGSGLRITLRQH